MRGPGRLSLTGTLPLRWLRGQNLSQPSRVQGWTSPGKLEPWAVLSVALRREFLRGLRVVHHLPEPIPPLAVVLFHSEEGHRVPGLEPARLKVLGPEPPALRALLERARQARGPGQEGHGVPGPALAAQPVLLLRRRLSPPGLGQTPRYCRLELCHRPWIHLG